MAFLRAALPALAILLGQGAAAQQPPAGGSAVQPAPAMTPSGRVTPGGVRNARRHRTASEPSDAQDTPAAPVLHATPLEIARSFLAADVRGQGELTREEAARLALQPRPFDEMDANHDGVLTRSEYEDAFQH